MRHLPIRILLLIASTVTVGSAAFAQDLSRQASVDLCWSDDIGNPNSDARISPFSTWAARTPTLGLCRAQLDVYWRFTRSSELFVSIRPDALQRMGEGFGGSVGRDFDSRAWGNGLDDDGTIYQATLKRGSPSLYLLDAYRVAYLRDDDFQLGIGVYDSLAAPFTAYPTRLEFGLNARFIRKFHGVDLIFKLLKPWEPTAQVQLPEGFQFRAMLLQGDGDRGESFDRISDTSTGFPTASDPYVGSALDASWFAGASGSINLTVGQLTDQIGITKRKETFGRLGGRYIVQVSPDFEWHLTGEVRVVEERGEIPALVYPAQQQQYFAWTNKFTFSSVHDVLLGAAYGLADFYDASQSSNKLRYTGYQVDLGYAQSIAEGLSMGLQAAHEYRQGELDNGLNLGGFGPIENRTNFVRRFVLSIQYQVQD